MKANMKALLLSICVGVGACSHADAETFTAFKLADMCYADDSASQLECTSFLMGVWMTANVFQAANGRGQTSPIDKSTYLFCDRDAPPTAGMMREAFNAYSRKGTITQDMPAAIAALAAFGSAFPCRPTR